MIAKATGENDFPYEYVGGEFEALGADCVSRFETLWAGTYYAYCEFWWVEESLLNEGTFWVYSDSPVSECWELKVGDFLKILMMHNTKDRMKQMFDKYPGFSNVTGSKSNNAFIYVSHWHNTN